MSIRKAGLTVSAVAVVAACAVACSSGGGGGGTGASAASNGNSHHVTGKISVTQPVNTPEYNAAVKFADLVKSSTGGRVELKVYGDDELGAATAIVQQCEQGTIAFCQEQALDGAAENLQAAQGPYLFDSLDQASKIINDPKLSAIWTSEFAKKKLTYLGQWVLPPAGILTKSRAVHTPADLKGLKVRVPNAYIGGLMFNSVGAVPLQMALPQVTAALATNTVNAVDDPVPTLYTQSWTSTAKYLTLTYDWYGSDTLVASSNFMDKLSAADQQAVKTAFASTLSYNTQQEQAQLNSVLDKLKAVSGLTIITPDRSLFKKAFSPANTQMAKKYPKVMSTILDLIQSAS